MAQSRAGGGGEEEKVEIHSKINGDDPSNQLSSRKWEAIEWSRVLRCLCPLPLTPLKSRMKLGVSERWWC
jgi:hypothetical protein